MASIRKKNTPNVVVHISSRKKKIKPRSLDREFLLGLIIVSSIVIFFIILFAFKADNSFEISFVNATAPETVVTKEGKIAVSLKQSYDGHYIFLGKINGTKVKFLLDTGATNVAIPQSVATHLGLFSNKVAYAQTANGRTLVYKINLDSIQVGGIKILDVSGSIMPNMEDDKILLGMSFLKHLQMNQENGEIKLVK